CGPYEDPVHARKTLCRPEVDVPDTRVRVRAPDESDMKGPGKTHVVGICRLAAEKARILHALHASAKELRHCHRLILPSSRTPAPRGVLSSELVDRRLLVPQRLRRATVLRRQDLCEDRERDLGGRLRAEIEPDRGADRRSLVRRDVHTISAQILQHLLGASAWAEGSDVLEL